MAGAIMFDGKLVNDTTIRAFLLENEESNEEVLENYISFRKLMGSEIIENNTIESAMNKLMDMISDDENDISRVSLLNKKHLYAILYLILNKDNFDKESLKEILDSSDFETRTEMILKYLDDRLVDENGINVFQPFLDKYSEKANEEIEENISETDIEEIISLLKKPYPYAYRCYSPFNIGIGTLLGKDKSSTLFKKIKDICDITNDNLSTDISVFKDAKKAPTTIYDKYLKVLYILEIYFKKVENNETNNAALSEEVSKIDLNDYNDIILLRNISKWVNEKTNDTNGIYRVSYSGENSYTNRYYVSVLLSDIYKGIVENFSHKYFLGQSIGHAGSGSYKIENRRVCSSFVQPSYEGNGSTIPTVPAIFSDNFVKNILKLYTTTGTFYYTNAFKLYEGDSPKERNIRGILSLNDNLVKTNCLGYFKDTKLTNIIFEAIKSINSEFNEKNEISGVNFDIFQNQGNENLRDEFINISTNYFNKKIYSNSEASNFKTNIESAELFRYYLAKEVLNKYIKLIFDENNDFSTYNFQLDASVPSYFNNIETIKGYLKNLKEYREKAKEFVESISFDITGSDKILQNFRDYVEKFNYRIRDIKKSMKDGLERLKKLYLDVSLIAILIGLPDESFDGLEAEVNADLIGNKIIDSQIFSLKTISEGFDSSGGIRNA